MKHRIRNTVRRRTEEQTMTRHNSKIARTELQTMNTCNRGKVLERSADKIHERSCGVLKQVLLDRSLVPNYVALSFKYLFGTHMVLSHTDEASQNKH